MNDTTSTHLNGREGDPMDCPGIRLRMLNVRIPSLLGRRPCLRVRGAPTGFSVACRWNGLGAMSLKVYRLRDPVNHDEVYGDVRDDESAAWERAATVADFYGHPVEVCAVVGGILAKPVGEPVQ